MTRVAYEMNITQAEFERLLPAAVSHQAYAVSAGEYCGTVAAGTWRIRLGPERQHTIGLIRLPLRQVEIVLEGFAEEEARAFHRRFDLYFQKGGG